jgi:hypothetical protein
MDSVSRSLLLSFRLHYVSPQFRQETVVDGRWCEPRKTPISHRLHYRIHRGLGLKISTAVHTMGARNPVVEVATGATVFARRRRRIAPRQLRLMGLRISKLQSFKFHHENGTVLVNSSFVRWESCTKYEKVTEGRQMLAMISK